MDLSTSKAYLGIGYDTWGREGCRARPRPHAEAKNFALRSTNGDERKSDRLALVQVLPVFASPFSARGNLWSSCPSEPQVARKFSDISPTHSPRADFFYQSSERE